MHSIGLEALLTPEAKQKIDEGIWRLIGVTVQDTIIGKMTGSATSSATTAQGEA
ncbi:UNVERIFIED_ORG: hypothetical protein M2402_005000 [Rahnella aquatilis]